MEQLPTARYVLIYPCSEGLFLEFFSTLPTFQASAEALCWRLQCEECGRRFNSPTSLDNHVNSVHRGVRPFQCDMCEKRFAQKATLRTHMRTHTGEKPYQCKVCKRKFADLSTKRKHERVHDGLKPYSCDVCGKSFSQSGNMLRHRESHERDRRANYVSIHRS